ncbi:unnamed protein product, partial [Rotaria magnacalcarata]
MSDSAKEISSIDLGQCSNLIAKQYTAKCDAITL